MINSNNINKINALIDNFGLEKTWMSLLYTHIKNSKKKFNYILKDNLFAEARELDLDILADLSIGEISILYEYSLAYANKDKRKENGQYFTPDDVSIVMSAKSEVFPPGIWLDPCSGVGNLSYWLVKKQKNPEFFISNSLYLVDIDKLALIIARTLFTLSFQKKDKNFFGKIEKRFVLADFLESSNIPNYDYAILNPPYVVVEENNNFISSKSRNLYAYFLEKVTNTSKGFVSITPQSFTNSQNHSNFRKILIENFNEIYVYCFDNVPANIFKGIKFGSNNSNKVNSTRAAITVAIKNNKKEKNFYITPLLRWKAPERKKMFKNLDSFLTKVNFSEEIFPKIDKNLVELYNEALKFPQKIGDIIQKEKSEYSLQIPSTPRYYISALKTPVARKSFRVLYFKNEKDLNTSYLLLNSSYFYWWWRVNDGGMVLSENTLLSLPIPTNIKISKKLVRKLEESESKNKVYKKNAGLINENVKHEKVLLKKINTHIFPKFSKKLLKIHNNSIF